MYIEITHFIGANLNCGEDFLMYVSDKSYTNPWYSHDWREYRECASKTAATNITECIFYCQASANIKDVFIWGTSDAKLETSPRLTELKIY